MKKSLILTVFAVSILASSNMSAGRKRAKGASAAVLQAKAIALQNQATVAAAAAAVAASKESDTEEVVMPEKEMSQMDRFIASGEFHRARQLARRSALMPLARKRGQAQGLGMNHKLFEILNLSNK